MSNKIVTGRTLKTDGTLVRGTGIELDADGPTAQLLQEIKPPLITNPVTGECAANLVLPAETGGEYLKAMLISPGGADGPPEHFHPAYYEEFEIIEGEFQFLLKGNELRIKAGETLTIEPGDIHTFRPADKFELNTLTVILRPPGLLRDLVNTLFGLAHEGKLNKNGVPDFLQAIALGKMLREDTIFTKPPPVVQKIMFSIFAPLASLLGYRATYPKYSDEEFWTKRVEQFSGLEH